MEILNRFLSYVKIPTSSDYDCKQTPSTKEQFNLANYLVKELNDLGLNVNYDK